jgi:hypothetical protein
VADVAAALKGGNGIAFAVSAGLVLEGVAAYCSSPQTTQLNAKTRADTLMKWVWLGLLQSAFLVGIAAWIDKAHRGAIIAGGATAGAMILGSYIHAKNAGLKDCAPGTESY